ncbi:MAG: phospholipase D-like domain-containing protein [Ktedonobacteraceae bacterium]
MRVRHMSEKGLTVQAVAGTFVVLLGFDLPSERRAGLLGFAVHRNDMTEHESRWLPGALTFPGMVSSLYGASTNKFPIQRFRWGDYTAKPEHSYRYRVQAMYGKPGALEVGDEVAFEVQTEDPLHVGGGMHQVHFNRSAAASQAYVRKFGDADPAHVVDGKAFAWLSRGLEESLIAFIDRAEDETYALYLCVYEFQKDNFLSALHRAAERKVHVEIIYDAIQGKTGPRESNLAAIQRNQLEAYCHPRANATNIFHHKFIVLAHHGEPLAVWTGSTNFTDGAIYGQANVGHAIEDKALAAAYMQLHQHLLHDPDLKASRQHVETLSPTRLVAEVLAKQASPYHLFSPRSSLVAIETIAELVHRARHLVCFTAPFGLDHRLNEVLDDPQNPFLAFGLLNRADNTMEAMQRTASDQFVTPARISTALDAFQVESLHHRGVYIHTKSFVIDPFSAQPIVVTGSANFSRNSSLNNDENQLIIVNQPAVTDVYLGEFMRLYDHYQFRYFLARGETNRTNRNLHTDDSWTDKYFRPGLELRDRLIFSGSSELE